MEAVQGRGVGSLIYTVIGWDAVISRSTTNVVDAASGLDAVLKTVHQRSGRPAWTFIVAFQGRHRMMTDLLTCAKNAVRPPFWTRFSIYTGFTVIGFWRFSAETVAVAERGRTEGEALASVLDQLKDRATIWFPGQEKFPLGKQPMACLIGIMPGLHRPAIVGENFYRR